MARQSDVYVDLDGKAISLAGLDAEEKRLVARLRRRAQTHPDWCDFGNYWTRVIGEFYGARGMSRKRQTKTVPFEIAQDLGGRLGIAQGLIRPPDYRDDLEELIEEHFPSRRAFCKATGISEDMLSHVLAGRKDLSLSALEEALGRIGYGLHILPSAARKQTG
jgi:hypothetical protein